MTLGVDEQTRSLVLSRLKTLEEKHEVRIIYACESGSRGWGFPSPDSDYDVRFLYVRTPEWYLSIHRGRDVIEEPIVDDFDINGWDIRKALGLLHKSNPALLEWLGSPIVYLEDKNMVNAIRTASKDFWSPATCFLYYRNKARDGLKEFLNCREAGIKKFFYILRPLLAIQWIERGLGIVPTDFNILVRHLVENPVLQTDIQTLLHLKRHHREVEATPPMESIDSFIKSEMSRVGEVYKAKAGPLPIEPLDALFRQLLKECWDRSSILNHFPAR